MLAIAGLLCTPWEIMGGVQRGRDADVEQPGVLFHISTSHHCLDRKQISCHVSLLLDALGLVSVVSWSCFPENVLFYFEGPASCCVLSCFPLPLHYDYLHVTHLCGDSSPPQCLCGLLSSLEFVLLLVLDYFLHPAATCKSELCPHCVESPVSNDFHLRSYCD